MFLKSPPWNSLLANLIIATIFLFKFSFSPGVRAVHRSQFQATSALWSKASNLHYSLMRLPPSPLPPSPAKHTQLFYVGLCHSRGGVGPGPVGLLWRTRPGTPHGGPGWWKFGSPRMPGRAQSAFCDGPELHHHLQAGSAIENAEAGSAIECFCSRIVVSQIDKRINI